MPASLPGLLCLWPRSFRAARPLCANCAMPRRRSGVRSPCRARRFHPLHVSIVGGEPLVRARELEVLIPRLNAMGVEVMVVTSAVSAPYRRRAGTTSPTFTCRSRLTGFNPSTIAAAPPPPTSASCGTSPGTRSTFTAHHPATHPAARLFGGFCALLVRARRSDEDMVQPLHSSGGRSKRGAPDAGRSRSTVGDPG